MGGLLWNSTHIEVISLYFPVYQGKGQGRRVRVRLGPPPLYPMRTQHQTMACHVVATIQRVVEVLRIATANGDAFLSPMLGSIWGLSPNTHFGHQTIARVGVQSSGFFRQETPGGVFGPAREGASFPTASIVQR